jgi:hypothetical protein
MKKIIVIFGMIAMLAFPTFAITSVETDTSDVLDGFFYEVNTEIYYEDFQQDDYFQELNQEALEKVKEMFGFISKENIQKYIEKLQNSSDE